jgi:hypothetical protein
MLTLAFLHPDNIAIERGGSVDVGDGQSNMPERRGHYAKAKLFARTRTGMDLYPGN